MGGREGRGGESGGAVVIAAATAAAGRFEVQVQVQVQVQLWGWGWWVVHGGVDDAVPVG